MKPVLSALGILNALGDSKQTVLDNFLSGTANGMQKNEAMWTGKVTAALPAIPEALAQFNCRNNRYCWLRSRKYKQKLTRRLHSTARRAWRL